MKKLLLVLCVFFAPAAFAQKKVDVAAELRSVVQAEREFARTAAASGMRASFLAFIADDGLLFRPGPVSGKKWWTERPERPGLLSWEPVYADVARAGDIGYTTGPWEFRAGAPADKPAGYGQFMTIWGKQPDGTWKFLLDIGTSNPAPTGLPPSLSFASDFRKNTDKDKLSVNTARVRDELLKLERDFASASAKDTAAAFDAHAAGDIRLMRDGHFPFLGKEAMRKALAAEAGALAWEPAQAVASRSGELGYTYGTYELRRAEASAVERGHYVRIWKKKSDGGKKSDDSWKVVLDLLSPLPPPPSAN
ncbi:MAG TPA: nuclear transport factor 2 family protein [Pyrinomonadaceae bacterium]